MVKVPLKQRMNDDRHFGHCEKKQDFCQVFFSSFLFLSPFLSFLLYLLLLFTLHLCFLLLWIKGGWKVFYALYYESLWNVPKWEIWLSFSLQAACAIVSRIDHTASESQLSTPVLRSRPPSARLSDCTHTLVIHRIPQSVVV